MISAPFIDAMRPNLTLLLSSTRVWEWNVWLLKLWRRRIRHQNHSIRVWTDQKYLEVSIICFKDNPKNTFLPFLGWVLPFGFIWTSWSIFGSIPSQSQMICGTFEEVWRFTRPNKYKFKSKHRELILISASRFFWIHPEWAALLQENVPQVKLDWQLKCLLPFCFYLKEVRCEEVTVYKTHTNTYEPVWAGPCLTAFQLRVNHGAHAVVFEYLMIIKRCLTWTRVFVCCLLGLG